MTDADSKLPVDGDYEPEAPCDTVRPYHPALSPAPDDDDVLADCFFAIFPDDVSPGARARPIAVFDTLEDAMDWGLQRFPGGAFRVRQERMVLIDSKIRALSGLA